MLVAVSVTRDSPQSSLRGGHAGKSQFSAGGHPLVRTRGVRDPATREGLSLCWVAKSDLSRTIELNKWYNEWWSISIDVEVR